MDLTKQSFEIAENGIPSSVYETFLGGKGLGTYLLYQYNPPGVDPLSPENRIIFATGPVSGSRIWGSCRYGVFTKSPQTMLYSESYSGGKAPEAIDSAGYDAIIISGKSTAPTVLSIHPKGLEPAGYDPRVLKGMGLAYATSDRGACHLRATFYKPELSGVISPEQTQGKAQVFVDYEDRLTLFDAMVFCRFYRDMYMWEKLEEVIGMLTGLKVDKSRLQEMAASISTLVRRFNIREGMLPEDDSLSAGLFQKLKGAENQLTQDELDYMLKDYCQLRGWDETGVPPGDAI